MDIAGVSMALAQVNISNKVGTAVLDNTMETAENLAAGMVEMIDAAAMERSVNPAVGGNFDFRGAHCAVDGNPAVVGIRMVIKANLAAFQRVAVVVVVMLFVNVVAVHQHVPAGCRVRNVAVDYIHLGFPDAVGALAVPHGGFILAAVFL